MEMVADKVRRHGLMRLRLEPMSVMLWQCAQNSREENEYQGEDNKEEAGGEPTGNEPQPARDTQVGIEEGEHQATAATAAARMSRASATCATLPAAPEPPPKSVCVMVGTIVMLRMKAMNTAMTPYRFAIHMGSE
jgi:hypothetical protein